MDPLVLAGDSKNSSSMKRTRGFRKAEDGRSGRSFSFSCAGTKFWLSSSGGQAAAA